MFNDTIAAVATAPGRAGISVIRISGSCAFEIAEQVFCAKSGENVFKKKQGYKAFYGSFIYKNRAIDDGIALCFKAPHSYTGEDVIELSCHGGIAVTEAVLQSCFMAGAVAATAGEFTKRAVLNGRLSLAQAEAVMEIIAAESSGAAKLAKTALDGVLFKKINEMSEKLTALAAHLAAWTDYPEEDVEPVEKDRYYEVVFKICNELEKQISRFEKGNIIRRGVNVAIVGKPNVGKSSIFNLLSGQESAIVTPLAGTTRDVIKSQVEINGLMFNFSDTAGIHETEDLVEKEGIRRTKQEMEKCSLLLAVFDASQPLGKDEINLALSCKERLCLAVFNKSDLNMCEILPEIENCFTKLLVVSANDEKTAEIIQQELIKIVGTSVIDMDEGILANQRQLTAAICAHEALKEAISAFDSGLTFDAASVCVDDALRYFALITGQNATEALVNEIFSKFCVGK